MTSAVLTLSLLLAVLPSEKAGRRPVPQHPNVLVVTLGSVRADAVGPGTPVLQALTARGITFGAARTTDNPVDSTFTLLTGYDRKAIGSSVDRPQLSIAAQVEHFGYRTFAVVANQNVTGGLVRPVASIDQFVNVSTVWQTMPFQERQAYEPHFAARAEAYGVTLSEFDRGMLFASADQVLARLEPMLDGEGPFFGLVNFEDAHDPYLPDPARYDASGETAAVPSLRERAIPLEIMYPEMIRDTAYRSYVEDTLQRALSRAWSTTLDLTDDQIDVYRQRYLAEVREVDAAVGRLMAMLEQRGLAESTIVVLVSTNGEEFGETSLITHSFAGRGDPAATMDAVLTILLPPAYRAEPRVVSTPVNVADVAPTLYDLLQIRAEPLLELAPNYRGTSRAAELGVVALRMRGSVVIPPDQARFDPPDDSDITIHSADGAAALRRDIIRFVWGSDTLPDARPSSVRNVENFIAGLQDFDRIDELRTTVDGREIGVAYHFVPTRRNGDLVIMHAGHGCQSLDDGIDYDNYATGMARTIGTLLAYGYGVAAVHMPRQSPLDCGTGDFHKALFDKGVPQGMRYFLEPVAAVVNSLTGGNLPYHNVHMLGLSGGGWTTVLYSAIDPRIRHSISVAGSLPLYLRTGTSVGDFEQYVPEFYSVAGYLDLYVLDAADPGRTHLQIFIENDDCCFNARQYPDPPAFEPALFEYAGRVTSTVETIGGGSYEMIIDRKTPHHTISRSMLSRFILPALREEDATQSPHP